jgi:hypothetical protein
MNGKLIMLIILCLIGIIVFLKIKISSLMAKSKGKRLLIKINDDTLFAREFASELTSVYAKENATGNDLKRKMSGMSGYKFKNHTVLLSKQISESDFLLITEFSDIDFNITVSGTMGDIKRLYQFNYVLRTSSNEMKVCSDMFRNNEDKNFRIDFADSLINYLTESV